MVSYYTQALGNTSREQVWYLNKFTGRRVPNTGRFLRSVQHLRDHGSLMIHIRDKYRLLTK
jgi:hypothetical protein